MKSGALVCSDNERQRLADTLRLYVGQGRRVSWAALADATGIREGTLRSYVAQGGPEKNPLAGLSVAERADYDLLKRNGYSRDEALAAIGRGGLVR